VARRRHGSTSSAFPSLADFATVDPDTMSGSKPHRVPNLLNGSWSFPAATSTIVDPMNGEAFMEVADTSPSEVAPFVDSLNSCSKSGLHNPLKANERYLLYGDVSHKVVAAMREPEVEDFFVRLIQRTAPKSDGQARGEVVVSRRFFENFCGDQVCVCV